MSTDPALLARVPPPGNPTARRDTIQISEVAPTGNPISSEAAPALAEGTPQAFGGTAGLLNVQDPNTLPNDPGNTLEKIKRKIKTPSDSFAYNTAILNRNALFNLSDYEKIMLGRQAEKLQQMGSEANQQLKFYAQGQNLFNLSLTEILTRTSQVVLVVFLDLLRFFSAKARKKRRNLTWAQTWTQMSQIFLEQNRILYLGVFLVFLSIVFMVLFLSS